MAGKRDAPASEAMTFRVRLGVPVLDAGYTLVPNLLLDHYAALGLTDGTALFVIRLLRHELGNRGPLPDSPEAQAHLQALRDRGLLRVQRWPDRVELRLDALFHNLARLRHWLAQGQSPDDFKLEVPPELLSGSELITQHLDSPEFEAEVNDVLAVFAAANQRAASPAEKDQIRRLALRFDATARAADESSSGPAWVMAAIRSVLESRSQGNVSVSDLEQTLERRMAVPAGATGPADGEAKAVRREVMARARRMSAQEKEALETVITAYRGISGCPPNDQLILTLMDLSDKYGSTWVVSAILEVGKVQQLMSPEYVESILVRWQSEGRIPDRPATAEPEPVTDPLLARVTVMYEQEISPLTPQAGEQLKALTEEFQDVNEWQRAFAEAAKSNARNLRYVEAVLRKKGKKPAPTTHRSAKPHGRRGTRREGVWTEEELEAARRRALSQTPLDPQTFFEDEE